MFGSNKSPLNKFVEHNSVDPDPNSSGFDDHGDEGRRNSSYSTASSTSPGRNKYKNDFRESGGYENQSVQELENYAVYKAAGTTTTVNDCLKIAEDIRDNAAKTLVTLHQQDEQITRTHEVAADIDHDLSRGGKLLGNLGGIFSKTWKPKKTHQITGPIIITDDLCTSTSSHLEQKEGAGLNLAPKGRSYSQTPPPEPTNALEQVELGKGKQDDALSNITDILRDLKVMADDIGSEIERHDKAMDHLHDDVDDVNVRVKVANPRARRLIRK